MQWSHVNTLKKRPVKILEIHSVRRETKYFRIYTGKSFISLTIPTRFLRTIRFTKK